MTDVLINKELTLSVPEGYRLMDAVELENYFGLEYNRWGILDKKRSIIVSVSWTDKQRLSMFADVKSMTKDAEATFKKNLKGYTRTEEFRTTVSSEKALGLKFEYITDKTEAEQAGEVVIVRFKKKFYAIYYISVKAKFAEYLPEFETMLASIRYQDPDSKDKKKK